MESQELRIFRAVAYEGSITKAAQALGYVQSNVTARVQQLEAELNTQLFYRHRGMILTPAGQKLLEYAERVIHLLEAAEAALHDSSEPRGRLLLGANPTASLLYLPNLLAHYHKAYPQVELSLTTNSSEELVRKIRQFQLDGAFVKTSVQDDNLIEELIHEEELVLITKPGVSNLQAIARQPFLMNAVGCPHREVFEKWLQSQGIDAVRYLEFNHLDAMIQGVIVGLGASCVPKSAIKQQEEKGLLQSFAIPAQKMVTQTFFIRHKDVLLTSAFLRFLECLRNPSLYRNNE